MMDREVNRIIEVDVDTTRNSFVVHRRILSTTHRENPLPDVDDQEADIITMVFGLASTILNAERNGIYDKGKAMRFAVDLLNQTYVDSENDPNNVEFDSDGKVINEH
jgi:hypothetical protein